MSLMVALEFLMLFLFSLLNNTIASGKIKLKLEHVEITDESIKLSQFSSANQLNFSTHLKIGSHKHIFSNYGKENPYTFPKQLSSLLKNPILYHGNHIKVHLKMNVSLVIKGTNIDSVRQQLDITPDNEQRTLMITMTNNSKLSISYRAVCDRHYYGQHCDKHCYHRNDDRGHFSCDAEGRKRCLKGYKDPGRNCTTPDVAAPSSTKVKNSTTVSPSIDKSTKLNVKHQDSSTLTWIKICFGAILVFGTVIVLILLFPYRSAIYKRFRECCRGQGPEGPPGGTQPSNNDVERIQMPAENGENERDVRPEENSQLLSRYSNVTGSQTHLSFLGIHLYVMDKDKKCDESINHEDELGDDLQVRIDEAKCDGVEEAMGAAPVALVARYIGIEDYIEENEAIAVTVVEDGNGGSESLRNFHDDLPSASDDKCKEANEIGRVNSDADENSDSAQRMGQIEKKEMHADPLAKRELKKTPDLILPDKELKNVFAVAFLWLLLESSQFNLIKVQQSVIASQSVYWCYMIFHHKHGTCVHEHSVQTLAQHNYYSAVVM